MKKIIYIIDNLKKDRIKTFVNMLLQINQINNVLFKENNSELYIEYNKLRRKEIEKYVHYACNFVHASLRTEIRRK